MRILLVIFLVAAALLGFVYAGGGKVLIALGGQAVRLERQMKGLVKDVREESKELQEKAAEVPQDLKRESREMKNILSGKPPPKKR
jgi:hypothetical protein